MSLVENLISQISTSGLSGITKPTGFDIDDDTFAKLLDKQMATFNDVSQSNLVGNLGMPAGFNIEPLEGTEFAEAVQDQMEILGETKLSREEYINQPIEFKNIDVGDYFSTLLKSQSGESSDFMNFARKYATNAYNVFSKSFVVDMQDFVDDITSNI